MKTYTVRDFHSVSQLDGDKTYNDLPVVFEGGWNDVHDFCRSKGYSWKKDASIFGGHYVDNEGKCLMIV